MKKLSLLFIGLMLLGLTSKAQYGGGTGTTTNPYQIKTAAQFDYFMNHVDHELGKHYRIMNDIDLTDYINTKYPQNGWLSNRRYLDGYLHGGGHVISGMWANHPEYVRVSGLFTQLKSGDVIDSLGIVIDPRGISCFGETAGLISYNQGRISQCFVTGGKVTALHNQVNAAGGLVNMNFGTISNCYTSCDVAANGGDAVGGLVGSNIGTIEYCYSTGKISSPSATWKGGLIGRNYGTVTNSYFDMQTSQQTNGVGANFNSQTPNVVGKTSAQMKLQSTYVNWNFTNIWKISSNTYPCFKWDSRVPSSGYAGGTGTQADPYRIVTAEQFDYFMNDVDHALGKHYRIMNDIDLTDYINTKYPQNGWLSNRRYLDGYLHGGGHVISGMWANHPDYVRVSGLFTQLKSGDVIDSLGLIIDPKGISCFGETAGLISYNQGRISQCFVSGGNVIAQHNQVNAAGGFVNMNFGTISDCYSTCNVIALGGGAVGGLVGSNMGNVEYCYSVGAILSTSTEWIGGFIGRNYGNIYASYFDTQTSRRTNGLGIDYNSQGNNISGKTTTQMKTQSTYHSSWLFGFIWKILPGYYPMLNWQSSSTAPRSMAVSTAILSTLNKELLSTEFTMSIYPNPTVDRVNIQTDAKDVSIEVYDDRGNKVISTNETTINLSAYPKGIYLFNVNGKMQKIIKK